MFWKLFKGKQKEASSLSWLDTLRALSRRWGLRMSRWLQRKTVTLSPGRLKGYAAVFILLLGSWNGWIVYQALQGRRPPIPAGQLYLSHPTIPAVHLKVDPSFSAGIGKFRSWLDSLQRDSAGQKIYDSIRRERPGLLDTVAQIDNRYSIHH